jgi:hypothetical protein
MFSKDLKGLTGRSAMRLVGKEEILSLCAQHGQLAVSEALSMANSCVLSVALKDLGWREGKEKPADIEVKTPRRPSQFQSKKGVLPLATEKWLERTLLADWIRDGNDEDNFIPPADWTPEEFFKVRAVRDETKAFITHLEKLGGLNSEAGKALRLWANKPLTKAQQENEERAKNIHNELKSFHDFRKAAQENGFNVVVDDYGFIRVI